MKNISMSTVLAFVIATSATAQHVTPADSAFTLEGSTTTSGLMCTLFLPGTTGADVGGVHTNHATGVSLGSATLVPNPSPGCASISVEASGFEVDSFNPTGGVAGLGSMTGSLYGVLIKLNGTVICNGPGPISMTGENISISPDEVEIGFYAIVDQCALHAKLTSDDIRFVP